MKAVVETQPVDIASKMIDVSRRVRPVPPCSSGTYMVAYPTECSLEFFRNVRLNFGRETC